MVLKAPVINDDGDADGQLNGRLDYRRWFLALAFLDHNHYPSLLRIHIRGTLANAKDDTLYFPRRRLTLYPSLRCYVFRMPDLDEEFQGPDEPSGWVQVEDLGADSLFLGLNHPLMGNLSEDLDLVGKSSWVYISDDRLTLRRRAEADWIGLQVSNV